MVEKYTREESDVVVVVMEILVLWYMMSCAVCIRVMDESPPWKTLYLNFKITDSMDQSPS
jgi:hypothetical protein